VGLAYVWRRDREPVTVDHLTSGRYEVDVGGRVCAATVGLKAPYDPANGRIRA
jgi:4-methylaminobutanoate oxidase (formaldehyde-forming)